MSHLPISRHSGDQSTSFENRRVIWLLYVEYSMKQGAIRAYQDTKGQCTLCSSNEYHESSNNGQSLAVETFGVLTLTSKLNTQEGGPLGIGLYTILIYAGLSATADSAIPKVFFQQLQGGLGAC